jgi:hypothetical protein
VKNEGVQVREVRDRKVFEIIFSNFKNSVMWREKRVRLLSKQRKMILFAAICLGTGLTRLYAQDGVAGIQEANTKVRGYFDVGCNLMYAVGAILGLIGAVKV